MTGRNQGECYIARSEINPLNLTHRPGAVDTLSENLEVDPFQAMRKRNLRASLKKENNEEKKTESAGLNKVRKKRDNISKAEAYTDGERKNVINMVSWFNRDQSNISNWSNIIRKLKIKVAGMLEKKKL